MTMSTYIRAVIAGILITLIFLMIQNYLIHQEHMKVMEQLQTLIKQHE